VAGRGGFARELCTKSARETTSNAYSNFMIREPTAPQPGLRWTSDKDSNTLRTLGSVTGGVRAAGGALGVHGAFPEHAKSAYFSLSRPHSIHVCLEHVESLQRRLLNDGFHEQHLFLATERS